MEEFSNAIVAGDHKVGDVVWYRGKRHEVIAAKTEYWNSDRADDEGGGQSPGWRTRATLRPVQDSSERQNNAKKIAEKRAQQKILYNDYLTALDAAGRYYQDPPTVPADLFSAGEHLGGLPADKANGADKLGGAYYLHNGHVYTVHNTSMTHPANFSGYMVSRLPATEDLVQSIRKFFVEGAE